MKRIASAALAFSITTAGIVSAPAAGAVTVKPSQDEECHISFTSTEWAIVDEVERDPRLGKAFYSADTYNWTRATKFAGGFKEVANDLYASSTNPNDVYKYKTLLEISDAFTLCAKYIEAGDEGIISNTPTTTPTNTPAQPQSPTDGSSSSTGSDSLASVIAVVTAIGGILVALTPLIRQLAILGNMVH